MHVRLKNSVSTQRHTSCIPNIKTNRLTLFTKRIIQNTYTLCGQNPQFFTLKASGTYNNHCVLKS